MLQKVFGCFALFQKSQNDTHLPPIDTKYGASPQNSPSSSRKMTVHVRIC